MTPVEFHRSLAKRTPPSGLSPALTAPWWAGTDDWNKAHELVMGEDSADCARGHAYPHRVEGDRDNARYWYRRAGREPPSLTLPRQRGREGRGHLAAEWLLIATALLGASR